MQRSKLVLLLIALLLLFTVGSAAAKSSNFRAHLSGANEVPAVDTNATGQANFHFRADGLHFKLIVANIDNVFAAHIHCAPAGVNGPVGVTLFMAPGNTGPSNGVLSEGVISAPNLGNACGWTSLGDVMAAMEAGNAYVNVHTNPGTPSGEIRGQVH